MESPEDIVESSDLKTGPLYDYDVKSISSKSGAMMIVEALKAEEVYLSFGIPGTHNIELYDAMENEPAMTPVLITDEQSAGFMADGAYRSDTQLCALNLVPGAGLTHALSGIAECYMDQIPVLVLLCEPRHDVNFKYQLHQIDQCHMVESVAKKVYRPKTHEDLFYDVRNAARFARQSPGGPTVVAIPAELYFKSGPVHTRSNDLLPPPLLGIHEGRFEAITRELNQAKNIGIYVGLGARSASKELAALADKLDAIVFTSISGKGVFDETNPRFAWNTMGRALPKQIQKIDANIDCLLAIGCRFGEVATASYGFSPPDTFIHVDIDPSVFNKNFKASLTLQADSLDFVERLLRGSTLIEHQPCPLKLNDLAKAHKAITKEQISHRDKVKGVIPADLYTAMQNQFDDDTVYGCDSGNGTFMAMESLRLKTPNSFLSPVDFSCMGYCIPAVIGAKLASPKKTVVATVGDGAFLMTGLEMKTAVTAELGILFCVLNDGKLSQISQFQKKALNSEAKTSLNCLNFEFLAKAVGMDYLAVNDHNMLPDILKKAHNIIKEGRPLLLDVSTDYSEPSYFTRGVLKTNFNRLEWKHRLQMGSRLLRRKLSF